MYVHVCFITRLMFHVVVSMVHVISQKKQNGYNRGSGPGGTIGIVGRVVQ